ncbi:LacI family DNA-binding transcriptional regulator [Sphingomonas sp. ac-8]|uniref:LacI family DNA-binding transcriptional regulator n=1 Tax=Sphingomonas sp. ac-8 TaxID=3242977 RepID=UPI003A804C1B
MTRVNGVHRKNSSTIEDVAAGADVSIRTVSRVLNRSAKVNEKTRKRVELVIEQLGFRPSARARALAMRRSFLIGLIHHDRNALVLGSIQRSLADAAAAKGYEVIVHPTPLEPQQAVEDVIAFAERSRVDGLIVLPPISEFLHLPATLSRNAIAAVALSSIALEGYQDVIVSDERVAGAQVARFLMDLGHRRLGIINGPADATSARERRAGFLAETSREAGVTVAEAPGDYGFVSGVAGAEQLLSAPNPPSGMFAANDIMAAGVLKVAARRGIAVPGALSVVGFDGSPITKMLTPAIASVHRPFAEMAAAAAERLIARIEGDEIPPTPRMTLALMPAESTGPAPK